MKKLVLILSATSLVVSCSFGGKKRSTGKPDTKGELVSKEKASAFVVERPHGMVAISGGSFVMGQSDMAIFRGGR